MAPLNPSIPLTGVNTANDPSYLSHSRPISAFEGDSSYEALFKGIGDVASSAIKGADFLVKEHIDSEVGDMIYREREAYTAKLEADREAATGKPTGILGTTDADLKIPGGINTGIGQVGALRTALDSGKVSQTYYHGRLTSIAKSMRNEYPGYREYIDKKIASITGVDPANAYISNMIQDINAMSTKKDKPLDDTLGVLKGLAANGSVAAAQAYNAVASGKATPEQGMVFAAQLNSWDWDTKQREALRKDKTGSRESQKQDASDTLVLKLQRESAARFGSIQLSSGLNTPQQISQIVQDALTGKVQITDDQGRELANSINAQKESFIQWALKEGSVVGSDGRTYVQILGQDGFRKMVEESASNFDRVRESILNKDWGLAFDNANMMEARLKAHQNGVLSDPTTGPIAKSMAAVNKFGGPEAVKGMARWFIERNTGQQFSELIRDQAYATFAQTDLRQTGNYVSLRDHITSAKDKNIRDGKYYDTILAIPERLADPKTSDYEKINIAKAAFGDKNSGFLSEFPVDGPDPANPSREIKGRYSAYRRMTSEDITKEIKRLDAANPSFGLWRDYINWTANEFRNDLFGNEIRTLSTFQKDPNVQVSYDSDRHAFSIKFGRGLGQDIPEDPFERAGRRAPLPTARYQEAERAVNRLNYGLTGIATVAKENGSDPNTFLLNLLIDAGYDPSKGGGLKNLPDALAREVAVTLGKKDMREGKGTKQ